MSEEGGGWLSDAISDGVETVRETTRSFLGVKRERFVCPKCNEACNESHTYDSQTAAFNQGQTPCWSCPNCDSKYHRDISDESHSMDIYQR